MKSAVFSAEPTSLTLAGPCEYYPIAELERLELGEYDAVFVLGTPKLDEETTLSRLAIDRLWRYVRDGGRLFAEMISAFDFPSSRLFGWKQDFPKTRRTMEKLRMTEGLGDDSCGLLEWEGAMAYGFSIHAERLLEFGVFRQTHKAEGPSAGSVFPALTFRKLGEGMVLYASFSMLSCPAPVSLRPHVRWNQVYRKVSEKMGVVLKETPPVVRASEGGSPAEAVKNTVSWFHHSGMLPLPDGRAGVCENIHSVTARLMQDRRPDCHAHTALLLYLYSRFSGETSFEDTAHNLMGHLFEQGLQDMDPNSSTYGFFKWYSFPEEQPDQIFTDDNAWVCLVLLYLYRRTGRDTYKVRGLALATAMLRTQHDNGLRPNMLLGGELRERGLCSSAENPVSMNPHFESIAHAAFLQAYLVTGERNYLDIALKGTLYLLRHEDELQFMYSRTSGLGRFLLPLSLLAKHDNSGEIREGLKRVTEELLSHRHASGAIEEADNPDPERFGQEDAGVFVYNGEGIADQLYTNNFLLMNAWEAWKATGEQVYEELYRGLGEFLCRIQIASGDDRFQGGWMRAFDLNRWEYFGNNGDTGWGPYCMESGWTNALIPAGLLLGLMNESIFD